MWQESSGDGHDERASRDMEFMFAKTDWEAPRDDKAYLDRERKEGMLSATELMMEDGDEDCWGEGASFNLATQAMVDGESWTVKVVIYV